MPSSWRDEQCACLGGRRLSALEAGLIAVVLVAVTVILAPVITQSQSRAYALAEAAGSQDQVASPANPPARVRASAQGAARPRANAVSEASPSARPSSSEASAPAATRERAPSPGAIVGRADIRDGDTLVINGERIRLAGADAFELHQTCSASACGQESRRALQRIVGGRAVTCEPQRMDRYGRTIADCFVDGMDIGGELVRQGHALAYRRYSSAYVGEEAAARSARAGAWAGTFDSPEDWRRANPRS